MRFPLLMLLAVACQAQGTWPYLTYFGGSGSENISAVSSDGNGGTFIAGTTSSVGPPFSTANEGYRSASSVFLTRIDASGQPVFTKLLGDGSLSALAVDADGNALLTGTIRVAPDFTTPGSFQPEASNTQAFVAKFTPSGDKLFATYFGSQNGVRIYTLTLDAEGRPIFCGSASGGSAPLTQSSLFQFEGRNAAPFCAQLTADGSGLVLSTLLSKPSANQISITTPLSADLDTEGRLIVGGSTSDSEFGVALDPQFEDRRRTLFRSRKGDRFEGIGGSRLGHVVSVQRIGKEVFVGTASNGAWVSPDGGDTWRQIPGAPSGSLVAHPLATRFLCVYTVVQAFCSQNGGSSWQFFTTISGQIRLVPDTRREGAFFITSSQPSERFGYIGLGAPAPRTNLDALPQWLTINPAGDRILAIVSNSLLLSEDSGATFRKLSDNVSRVASAPGDPNRIYTARYARLPGRDSLLIRSDDGGITWKDTTLDVPFPSILQLMVDPVDPNIVFVIGGTGTYRSLDGGASWQLWTPPGLDNIGVEAIHFFEQEEVWVGTASTTSGFLLKLNLQEPAIVAGAMFNGAGGAQISRVRVAADGRTFVAGYSLGADLPITGAALTPIRTQGSGFVGVIERTGEFGALRYIGVSPTVFDLAADGSVHLATQAVPADLGEVGTVRGTFAGGPNDAVWLVLSPNLDSVVRATWLGGDGEDVPAAIAAGRDGKVRLVGSTLSRNLPVSPDALQRNFTLYGGQILIGGEGFLAIAPQ